MAQPWYFDPMCDPAAIRQRAWRHCKNDRKWFDILHRVAGFIEEAREGWRP